MADDAMLERQGGGSAGRRAEPMSGGAPETSPVHPLRQLQREFGGLLARAREAKGWTLQDVQQETKIRLKYLEALEAGEFDQIPQMVYAKGFLRSYANAVGLDGPALVTRLSQAELEFGAERRGAAGPSSAQASSLARSSPGSPSGIPPAPPPDAPGRKSPAAVSDAPFVRVPYESGGIEVASPTRRARRPSRWFGLLVALAAIAVAFGVWVLLLARTGEAPGTPPAATEEPPAGTEQPPPSPPPPAVAVNRLTPVADVIPFTVTASPLEVKAAFTERVWVEVTSDGAISFPGRTLQPGDSAVWTARQTLRIVVGNPRGMSVTVNGVELGVLSQEGPRILIFRSAEIGP